MPRKDRSFRSSDLIRLARNNLTPQELTDVLLELCLGVKIEDFGLGPVIVPITSDEEALEDVDVIEIVTDIISGRIVSRLPNTLLSATGILISEGDLKALIRQSIR